MIHPWVFEFFHALTEADKAAGVSAKAHHDRHLSLWERDEALDFEGIFFSEHHFGPAYSPSPNLLVAAMASRTRKLRLGTLGCSTASAQALRIVEEAAMLDNLTDGRLEIGIVRGVPYEVAKLGMTIGEAEARFDEVLRVVDAAFRSAGAEFKCGGLNIEPPMRQTDPPKWVAVTSEGSASRGAALGWKACAGFVSLAKLKSIFDAYRAASNKGWNENLDRLGIRRRVLFWKDGGPKPTKAEFKEKVVRLMVDEDERGSRGDEKPDVAASQPTIDLEARFRSLLSEDEFVVGTPGQVADEIIEQCRTAGCAHFMAGLNSSPIFEDVAEAHQIFGEKVIPILRKADIARAGAA